MQIKEITDKSQWENFVLSQRPDTFLQSWNWGEFNLSMAGKIFRLGILDNQNLIGAALVIKVSARRGKFLFCPHGPIIKSSKFKVQSSKFWNLLFDYLKDLAKREKVDFIRISPLLENTPENLEIFKKAGFRNAPIHMMHPELSWLLDISKSEGEILAGMRKTTRNLIRRAEKPFEFTRGRENVEIEEVKNIEGIDEFYKLHKQTVDRHGFVPFSEEYLKKEFMAFAPDNQISIFFAKYGNQTLSSAVIVYCGDSAFYHHGASLASKVPASHLLIWKAIKAAKSRGCRVFNFWGIAPEDNFNHPWTGLTLFKKGFGGREEAYLHAQDLVINKKYWLNWLVESARRWKRGY